MRGWYNTVVFDFGYYVYLSLLFTFGFATWLFVVLFILPESLVLILVCRGCLVVYFGCWIGVALFRLLLLLAGF